MAAHSQSWLKRGCGEEWLKNPTGCYDEPEHMEQPLALALASLAAYFVVPVIFLVDMLTQVGDTPQCSTAVPMNYTNLTFNMSLEGGVSVSILRHTMPQSSELAMLMGSGAYMDVMANLGICMLVPGVYAFISALLTTIRYVMKPTESRIRRALTSTVGEDAADSAIDVAQGQFETWAAESVSPVEMGNDAESVKMGEDTSISMSAESMSVEMGNGAESVSVEIGNADDGQTTKLFLLWVQLICAMVAFIDYFVNKPRSCGVATLGYYIMLIAYKPFCIPFFRIIFVVIDQAIWLQRSDTRVRFFMRRAQREHHWHYWQVLSDAHSMLDGECNIRVMVSEDKVRKSTISTNGTLMNSLPSVGLHAGVSILNVQRPVGIRTDHRPAKLELIVRLPAAPLPLNLWARALDVPWNFACSFFFFPYGVPGAIAYFLFPIINFMYDTTGLVRGWSGVYLAYSVGGMLCFGVVAIGTPYMMLLSLHALSSRTSRHNSDQSLIHAYLDHHHPVCGMQTKALFYFFLNVNVIVLFFSPVLMLFADENMTFQGTEDLWATFFAGLLSVITSFSWTFLTVFSLPNFPSSLPAFVYVVSLVAVGIEVLQKIYLTVLAKAKQEALQKLFRHVISKGCAGAKQKLCALGRRRVDQHASSVGYPLDSVPLGVPIAASIRRVVSSEVDIDNRKLRLSSGPDIDDRLTYRELERLSSGPEPESFRPSSGPEAQTQAEPESLGLRA